MRKDKFCMMSNEAMHNQNEDWVDDLDEIEVSTFPDEEDYAKSCTNWNKVNDIMQKNGRTPYDVIYALAYIQCFHAACEQSEGRKPAIYITLAAQKLAIQALSRDIPINRVSAYKVMGYPNSCNEIPF